MTWDQWFAVALVVTPLSVKAFADVQAWLIARKHTALANIVGMAGREAATIGRTLAALPAGSTAKDTERALINTSTAEILTRMSGSASTVGADSLNVAGIVQGELNKLIVPLVAVPPIPRQPT